jgi:hypothetical protein
MAEAKPAPIRRDWWAKSLAGALLGLTLALAVGGMFMRYVDGPAMITSQIAMWVVPPVWMAVLSFCFLFRSGLRAWLWLLAANALAWALVWVGRPLPSVFGT